MAKQLICDTCGQEVQQLRRDVVDDDYIALNKPVMWNCEECYQEKRSRRKGQSPAESA
ncbi:MAG: hypothetical protein VX733_04730 [Candidatus Latescibacterota bacterium]|nr:hypothetical protein [Candidatus Latescibacterota bacterium]